MNERLRKVMEARYRAVIERTVSIRLNATANKRLLYLSIQILLLRLILCL